MKEITLTVDNLRGVKLDESKIAEYVPTHTKWFSLNPGEEHYRLLCYLSDQYEGETIIDIGTDRGASAYALGMNGKNNIITYDVVDLDKSPAFRGMPNVTEKYDTDLRFYSNEFKDVINKAPFIMFDISHNGTDEIAVFDNLKKNGYKGFIVCDDIKLNEGMRHFWKHVQDTGTKTLDVTLYGHWSGTGIILMGDDVKFNLL